MEQPIETDPNIAAFEAALAEGELDEIHLGHYIAFHDGEFLDYGPDRIH